MKRTISLVLSLCLAAGCQGVKEANFVETMQALKDAKARGHLSVSLGGPLLSVGQKTTFWLGPESVHLAFDGDVDFATGE